MKQKILFAVLLLVIFLLGRFLISKRSSQEMKASPVAQPSRVNGGTEKIASKSAKVLAKPEMIIDPQKQYFAILKTELGEIKIELSADKTPITVNNFVYLAQNNLYNETVFHRTIKGFMIQGGDPKGDGSGGPGYFFEDEDFEGEYTRGTVAMANAGPNSNGSQFFIMHEDYELPANYVIFGQVVEGMKTVDKIAEAPVEANPQSGEMSKPVQPVKVVEVEIIEK
ncbi:MAG TPA: peptidylprolyl isomerase [Clostridia bacterium]|nr:peptidylprolyl isomerase [Clostridia bacterium]